MTAAVVPPAPIMLARASRRDAMVAAAVIAMVAVPIGLLPAYLDWDRTADLSAASSAVSRWVTRPLAGVTVPVLACLLVVSVLHYVAAATATRAASGLRLPYGELVTAQLAASAANRLTPAGLGGAGLLGRYLMRRGRLTPTRATATVSALAMFGGLADILAFGVLIGLGVLFGLHGASSEVPLLLSRLLGLLPVPTGVVRWIAIGLAAGVIAILATPRLRRCAPVTRLRTAAHGFGVGMTDLVRRPRQMAVLMGASASTTMLLSAGFAATATLGPVGLPVRSFVAVMIGYMVAAAAGNALPTPGGIGTADAAFVGVLLTAGASAPTAFATVLAFRIATFWAPAAAGVFLARSLRHRGAL